MYDMYDMYGNYMYDMYDMYGNYRATIAIAIVSHVW